MATVKVKQCDRCGNIPQSDIGTARVKLPVGDNGALVNRDLCDLCLESLREWAESEGFTQ
jgi:hypothetical protein